jgi:hypothetical protein
VDRQDHPLDHLLSEDFVVFIMVDILDLQILSSDHKNKICQVQISDQNKSHEFVQLVATSMELWTSLEVTMKDPRKN